MYVCTNVRMYACMYLYINGGEVVQKVLGFIKNDDVSENYSLYQHTFKKWKISLQMRLTETKEVCDKSKIREKRRTF